MPSLLPQPLPRRPWAALLSVAAGMLLAGCGSGGTAAPGGAQAPAGAAPDGPVTPKVNRLVMAATPPDRENNDLKVHGMPDVWELRPMYEYLIGVDAKTGKLIPQLATEWQFDTNAPSVRFKLRQGIQFHQGAGEFTGTDVVFSRDQLISDEGLHGQKGYYKEVTKNIDVVNPYEIVFNLTRPDGNFIRAHSENEGGFEIRSKKDFDKIGVPNMQTRPLAGTGPYEFAARQQGQFVRYKRVDYKQWRATPDFPEFEFRWTKETSTRLAALLTGEVQVTGLSQDLQPEAVRAGMKVVASQQPGTRTFVHIYGGGLVDLNDPKKGTDNSPLGNPLVRKALDKALNRDEMNKAFLGGKGKVYAPVHYSPQYPGWDPSWEKRYQEEYGYDPAAARALLAQAGYGPNNPLAFFADVNATGSLQGGEADMMEAMAGYWRAIGANVTLDQSDGATLNNLDRNRNHSNHVRIRGSSSSQYLAIWVFHSYGYGGSLTNQQPYQPELNTLFGELRNTLDEKKQEDIYRQMGEILFTGHSNFPLFWVTTEAMVNPQFVADYVFPGSISGVWTHVENIKAAR